MPACREEIMKSTAPQQILKDHIRPITVGIIFLLTYAPTLIWLWDRWFSRDSYYSHGILVPFVTVYLIWQKREELAKLKAKKSPWGLALIILGISIHLVSSVFRVYFSSGFSMLIVLAGLVLYFYGSRIFRKILFPIAFLFFMMPLPLVVIINISFQMKIFAAEISERVLNGIGLDAVREGSIIRMTHAYVVVDDVCSGLRSLIALTALGSIFAYWLNVPVISLAAAGSLFTYWMKAPMPRRVLLFLSTIPIAIITNVCRIVLLSTVSEIWGPKYAIGFLHDATGFLVFALAFVLLYAAARLLE